MEIGSEQLQEQAEKGKLKSENYKKKLNEAEKKGVKAETEEQIYNKGKLKVKAKKRER